jgi:hypothetical protein
VVRVVGGGTPLHSRSTQQAAMAGQAAGCVARLELVAMEPC